MRMVLQKVFQQIVWLQLLVHKIEPSSCSRTHLLVTMKGVITRNDDSILNCKKTTMTLLLYSYATNFLQYEMTCEFRPPHCNSCSVKQYILAITSDFTNSEIQISTFQESFFFEWI